MKILTSKMRPSRRGPDAWFTGTVWIDEVVEGDSPSRIRAARVSFEPGARTAWHTHPVGQGLHVLSGVGWVQLQGQPAKAIRPGDTVWIQPGEVHWHGAAKAHTLVHLAMQEIDAEGSAVVWGDHVTHAEYVAADPA